MSKDDNTDLIPTSSLRELYDMECKKIQELLTTSAFLHDNSKYQQSILFSIIAKEESHKLQQIKEHRLYSKGFSTHEWKEMVKGGSHNKKLSGLWEHSIKPFKSMRKEEYEKIAENYMLSNPDSLPIPSYEEITSKDVVTSRLYKLNEIKKAILYLDWDKETSKPFLFSTAYDSKILKAFSIFLYDVTEYEFINIQLDMKYHPIPLPHLLKARQEDELYLAKEKHNDRLTTSEYKKIIYWSQMVLEFFPKPIPQKYFKKNKVR